MIRPRVLLADNEPSFLATMKVSLENSGYKVITACNPAEAREALRRGGLDVAILDIKLDPDDEESYAGIDIVQEDKSGVPKILLTAHADRMMQQISRAAKARGIDMLVLKDDADNGLIDAIEDALIWRIFVAHGHDEAATLKVTAWLKDNRLTVIDLSTQPPGRHFLQGLKEHSTELAAAIVLLTPDDEGRLRDRKGKMELRARQNVVFELGFFIAALGTERTMALVAPGVVPPSNYSGIAYIELDSEGGWQTKLTHAFRAAGIRLRPESPDRLKPRSGR